jgi:hypothetical protein
MFLLPAANQLNQQAVTRRVGMFPLPAANQLNQQAVTLRVVISNANDLGLVD